MTISLVSFTIFRLFLWRFAFLKHFRNRKTLHYKFSASCSL